MNHSEIVTARHLRVRAGQPGFVVIETRQNQTRVSFLFDREEAIEFGERMVLIASGVAAQSGPEGT